MADERLAIRDLPFVERPREKLVKYGPEKLTKQELLAVILRIGRKGENVLGLAGRILRLIDFSASVSLTFSELKNIHGLGQAKACQLLACFELGRRIFQNKEINISRILSPKDVFDNLKDMRESRKEHFVVFFLDARSQQIKREVVSIGTVNANLAHPREVFEPAVKCLAVQIITAHNHPSGNVDPSEEDLETTRRLSEAGKILGIELADHIIVTKKDFYSFKAENRL